MLIRTATPADWPRLYPIFASIVAAGESYGYPPDLSSDDARTLWMEPAPGHCVVALRSDGSPDHATDDDMLGTAKIGPNRGGRGSHIATASFMVNPAFRRTGAGRALGEYVIGWARQAGYRGIQFNAVVETNVAAVNLWTSLGFETIGTVPGAFEHASLGYVGLHVMYLPLV